MLGCVLVSSFLNQAPAMKIHLILLCLLFFGNSSVSEECNISCILNSMKNPQTTTNLVVHDVHLKKEDLVAIGKALNGSQITSLDFTRNDMRSEEAKVLADSLRDSQITSLSVARNRIRSQGVEAIAHVLNRTKINYLKLSGIFSLRIDSIAQVLRNTSITHLVLQEDIINAWDIDALVDGLVGSRVNTLELGWNYIQNRGVEALANVLNRTQITKLGLERNFIWGRGGMLAHLMNGTKITELNLGSNRIGDTGCIAIAQVLNESVITHLNLSHNGITDEAGMALGAVLNDSQVTDLDLSGNNINITVLNHIKSQLDPNRKRVNRILQQFADFVSNENGSLGFIVEKAFANVFEYIEFVEIIGTNKRIYSRLLSAKDRRNFMEEMVQDFVLNIETRLLECFKEAEYIYQQVGNCVFDRNGALDFNVENLYTNRTEYVEFAGIVAKKKQIFIERFSTEGRINSTRNQIQNFVVNIETRLSECLRRTELVYREFKSFLFDQSDNPKILIGHDDSVELVRNKQSFVNYLLSRGDGTYSEDQTEDFIDRVKQQLDRS